MAIEIQHGIASLDTVIKPLNKIFRKDFEKLLPKIYLHEEYCQDHYVCMEDGQFLGTLASIPAELELDGAVLRARGIGMVGVMKQARGKGAMDAMMRRAVEDAREEGMDFMFLSGLRQRYQRYGFVPGGQEYKFELTGDNFRKYRPELPYFFEPLRPDDDPALEALEAIYYEQASCYRRPHFRDALFCWEKTRAILVKDGAGEAAGYLLLHGGDVQEACLRKGAVLADVLYSYQKEADRNLMVSLYPYLNDEDILKLTQVAQSMRTVSGASFLILSYRRVLEVLLCARESLAARSYRVVLNVGAETLAVECAGGAVTVQETEETPQIVLDPLEAAGILTSPVLSRLYGLPFYLELFIPHADQV
ncbi:MAG: GNAT family N-acetyltransferase [Clostridiales bacterium]|nr:GNAT family N-acetyltransferase [Clostridiales bacterium]